MNISCGPSAITMSVMVILYLKHNSTLKGNAPGKNFFVPRLQWVKTPILTVIALDTGDDSTGLVNPDYSYACCGLDMEVLAFQLLSHSIKKYMPVNLPRLLP